MLVTFQNIVKTFQMPRQVLWKKPDVLRAVDGLELSINAGQHLGLVGESGCGKTTLARLLLRIYRLDAGKIFFDGKRIDHLSNRAFQPLRSQLQIVFQDPYSSLDPRFTVARILGEVMHRGEARFQTKEKRIKAMQLALASVKLPADILNRYPHEFSGGERQRIAIARALIVRPRLLVLDEAVSSLDVLVQKDILDLLDELKQQFGMTYIFITHNLRVVKKIAKRIAVMYKGRVVELAPTESIFKGPLHAYSKRLLKASMDYHVDDAEEEIELDKEARLVDVGGGHYVLE